MKPVSILCACLLLTACASSVKEQDEAGKPVTLTREALMDKIRGGWAGQTIGVVYGAPTEFKFCGTLIPEEIPIGWGEGYVKHWRDRKPGLFDEWLKSKGKLGGQHKIPRLSNSRQYIEELIQMNQ